MDSAATVPKKLPLTAVLIGSLAILSLIAGLAYLNRPVSKAADSEASQEAKAYLKYLALSDVKMQAAENFMKQQVVEIDGKIGNTGPRPIESLDLYCFFSGVDGKVIHRERVPVVRSKSAPLKTGEVRSFRLPFDSLPDGWNQALPKLVIAQINFAQ